MENMTQPSEPHDESAEALPQNGIVRDKPDPDPARAALVKEWQDKVMRGKKHWRPSFDRMKEDMDFFMGRQWPDSYEKDDRYVANLIQRHVSQRVSALYAKNPKFVARRRQTMDFATWDGDMASLQSIQVAMQNAMATGQPIDPVMMQTLQEVQQGFQKQRMVERIAKTMEIVAEHEINEQQPSSKSQFKALVRRACVTGVSYLKLGYHRVMEKEPGDVERINDITDQIATLQRLTADMKDGEFESTSAKMEQLKQLLKELSEREDIIVREGIVFDFPLSTSIIPDPKCRQLNGFIGAEWVAQEYILSCDDVKELYKVDLGSNYTAYEENPNGVSPDGTEKKALVWEIYSKKDKLCYVIADGYPDFLKEPDGPVLDLERFWPFFTLAFNEVESDKHIFPVSDVRMLMPIQKEYNRSRQALREHRHANRPAYATYMGALSEEDQNRLKDHPANAIIQMNNLVPGKSVSEILQPIQHTPLDPALYDTTPLLDDMMRTVGTQEANLGATGNSTATEVSVAEGSRMSSLGSNIDDLEDFLSDLARATGQVLLMQMDETTVKKIAGPGAVWPQLTAQDIAQELLLDVEAGSNGRPNKAVQISNWERLAPIMLQVPGMNPEWMLKETIKRLDDNLDPTEAIRAALPSIIAMNSAKTLGPQAQPPTGNPATDPASQGMAGSLNAQSPMQAAGNDGPQPPPSPGQIRAGHVPTP